MAILGGDSTQLNILIKARDDASKTLKALDKRVEKSRKNFQKMALVGAVAFAAVAAGALKTISVARDFEEETNKFSVVFKDVSKEAQDMANTLNESFGLSRLEATRLLAATGDILTGFGFTGEAALDLSSSVNTLAVDLASFTNAQGGAKAVSEALTKALLGERESLKTYGIAIQEADVDQQLLIMGKKDLVGESLRQAKAEATLQIALRQSKNAIGDYARSSGTLTQTQKELNKNISDFQVAVGQTLAPILNDLLKVIVPMIQGMAKWVEENKTLTKVIIITAGALAALVTTIGIAGLAWITLRRTMLLAQIAMVNIRTAIIAVRIAMVALLGPLGLVWAAIGVVAGGLAWLTLRSKDSKTEVSALETEIAGLETTLGDAVPAVADLATGLGGVSKEAEEAVQKIADLRTEASNVIKSFGKDEKDFSRNVAEAIVAQEEKVSALKKEIRELERDEESKADAQRLSELENSLSIEREALKGARDLKKSLSVEISEARRRAELTDFERTIENLMRERIVKLKEHVETLTRLVSERDAAMATHAAIQESFVAAQDAMQLKAKETANEQKTQFKVMVSDAFAAASAIGEAFGHKTSTPAFPSSLNLSSNEHGGIINAPAGKAVPILAHGQERIIPRSQTGKNGGDTFNVNLTIRAEDNPRVIKKLVMDSMRSVIRDRKVQTA